MKRFKRSIARSMLTFVVLAPLSANSRGANSDCACDPKNNRQICIDYSPVVTNGPTVEVLHNGTYTFVVSGVNDMLYTYGITITPGAAPVLPSLGVPGAASSTGNTVPAAKSTLDDLNLRMPGVLSRLATAPTTCATLMNDIQAVSTASSDLTSALSGAALKVSKGTNNSYPSISLDATEKAWDAIAPTVESFIAQVNKIDTDASSVGGGASSCGADVASQILSLDQLRTQLATLKLLRKGTHQICFSTKLDRVRGGTATVTEQFQGTTTHTLTVTLEGEFAAVTASGGFLLTELPARSYSSVNQPVTMGSTSTTETVLGVNGSSAIRPGLAVLFNFHDPFDWPLNRPNFGLAISAGPAFDISNGMADTSKIGFFGGVGFHLWKLLYVTPGVHVGQFADFPQGFTHAGQVIPANFGTLSPVERYSARFGITVTFKGFNLSNLGGGSQKSASPTTGGGNGSSNPSGGN